MAEIADCAAIRLLDLDLRWREGSGRDVDVGFFEEKYIEEWAGVSVFGFGGEGLEDELSGSEVVDCYFGIRHVDWRPFLYHQGVGYVEALEQVLRQFFGYEVAKVEVFDSGLGGGDYLNAPLSGSALDVGVQGHPLSVGQNSLEIIFRRVEGLVDIHGVHNGTQSHCNVIVGVRELYDFSYRIRLLLSGTGAGGEQNRPESE